MRHLIRPAVVSFVLLTLFTGVVYPLAVTGIALALFPKQATGSLFDTGDGKRVSTLVGQNFSDPRYFWPRPSAAGTFAYNPLGSAGSNLGPTNPALVQAVRDRVNRLKAADVSAGATVPVDLVTASASGIDPHISPVAAEYQAARVAQARGLSADDVRQLVHAHTEPRSLGFLGEPRVNVLELNLALDHRDSGTQPAATRPQVGLRACGFLEESK